jgi:hypothetical protein
MKVLASGKTVRTFTINNAAHTDGCPTKFKHLDYTGEFTTVATPSRAASKAVTQLCSVKRIRGQCTLYVSLRETSRESNKKIYTYKVKRVKLTEPGPFGNEYKNTVHAVKSIPLEKCAKSRKTSGRKSSRNMKKTKSKSHNHHRK